MVGYKLCYLCFITLVSEQWMCICVLPGCGCLQLSPCVCVCLCVSVCMLYWYTSEYLSARMRIHFRPHIAFFTMVFTCLSLSENILGDTVLGVGLSISYHVYVIGGVKEPLSFK